MNFKKMPENLVSQEKIRLNQLADELDKLQRNFTKRFKLENETIPYIDWIVQDLRRGDLVSAKSNYDQQRDKYDNKLEIKKFLEDNDIADRGIDWGAWKNSKL